MGMVVDPAALGGLAGLIAVAGWAIGHTHGTLARRGLREGVAAAATDRHGRLANAASADDGPPVAPPLAATPCQQRALEERRVALSGPFVLAELHAEVSAIRRDERVLCLAPDNHEPALLPRFDAGGSCRFIGLSGQPTCPAATRASCPDGAGCQATSAAAGRLALSA